MQELILALCVAATIITITAIKSPKLRAAVYVLPIPITIILLGTGGVVNATHLFGLLLVITFISSVWLLYERLKLPIIIAISLSIIVYTLLGLLNQLVIKVPFVYAYLLALGLWVIWIFVQPLAGMKPLKESKPVSALSLKDYSVRGAIVFAITYGLIGIRELILGAAVTFPFNGIFTTYIMKDQLLFLINEIGRNIFALVNFFGTIYLLQGSTPVLSSVLAGWIICLVSIITISKFVPRKRPSVIN